MTTSKPSQAPLFAIGSDEQETSTLLWPTPVTARNRKSTRSMTTQSSPPGLEQAIEMAAGMIPIEYEGIELTSMAKRMLAGGLTSSPAAIPASPSRSPGSAWARRMTAISGRGLRRWLPTSSLGAVFSRMSTDTSRWGSTMCWLTWNRSATPAGRSLFRLRPSAPRTGEIASGFWPTPTSSESTGAGHAAQGGMNLRTVVSMFPTPNTPSGGRAWPKDAEIVGNSAYRPNGQKVQIHLHHAVEMGLIPTPDANCWKGSESLDQRRGQLTEARLRMLPTPRHEGFDAGGHRGANDSLHSHVKMFPTPRAIYGEHSGMSDPSHLTGAAGASPTTGKLSAAWVMRLMGYPDGWLDLES